MSIKLNLDRTWDMLIQQYSKSANSSDIEEPESIEELEEDSSIDKEKEDIEEVVEASSLTSEDVHGGEEATKDIEESPKSAEDGVEEKNNSHKGGRDGEETEPSDEAGSGNAEVDEDNSDSTADEVKEESSNENSGAGYGFDKPEKESDTTGAGSFAKHESSKEEEIENFLSKLEDSRKPLTYNGENLRDLFMTIIKQLSKKYRGFNKSSGNGHYDVRKISKHLVTHQSFRVPRDKYSKSNAKEVLFFLDTSGSTAWCRDALIEGIQKLESDGYICTICGAGNGLSDEDADNDEYNVVGQLQSLGVGRLAKIVRPSVETAAKMANNATFSIILADFDGLSSFVEMSRLTRRDKIPYFFSTEHRYSWDDPCEHDWVSPDACDYPKNFIYNLDEYYEDDCYNDWDSDYDEDEDDYDDYDDDDYDDDDEDGEEEW